eukprot:5957321-Pleurochrysis_carterae.AAC.2
MHAQPSGAVARARRREVQTNVAGQADFLQKVRKISAQGWAARALAHECRTHDVFDPSLPQLAVKHD